MASDLFFPGEFEINFPDSECTLTFQSDNQGRYNRVMQLSNNIGIIKGFCAQTYEQISKSEDHIDIIRDQLMKQHGFKTLDEYAQSIANTLPDEDRKRLNHLLQTFKDADKLFAKASSILMAVMGSAGSLLFVSGTCEYSTKHL
jgi:hypothetical protein